MSSLVTGRRVLPRASLLYGGTFNPVHNAHIGVARDVAAQLPVETIRFIPNGDPPHRAIPKVSAQHRLAMLELALADEVSCVADAIEVKRAGASYTIDTLEAITRAGDTHYLLLGQDAFDHFYQWHRPDDIAELAQIIVINRPGYDSKSINDDNRSHLRASTLDNVRFVDVQPRKMSSTTIRQAFARGQAEIVRDWLHPNVFQYIIDHHFYVE